MGGGFPIKAFGNDTRPHGSGEWAVHNVFTECLRNHVPGVSSEMIDQNYGIISIHYGIYTTTI